MRAAACLVVLLALGATALPAAAETHPTGRSADEIRAYYASGAWNRAVTKQATRAKAWLRSRVRGRHAPRRPALVLDIDETSLNNEPCLDRSGGIPYAGGPYAACVLAYDAPAVKPVRSLVRLARALKVTVFFITGRPEALRDGTLANLRSAGFGSAGRRLTMLPASYDEPSFVPYKSAARGRIERRGFRILANVGDQRSDLRGGHAERTYKLPNPIYVNP